eukprot:4685681-Amphidinium_carterae.1
MQSQVMEEAGVDNDSKEAILRLLKRDPVDRTCAAEHFYHRLGCTEPSKCPEHCPQDLCAELAHIIQCFFSVDKSSRARNRAM